MPLNAFRMI